VQQQHVYIHRSVNVVLWSSFKTSLEQGRRLIKINKCSAILLSLLHFTEFIITYYRRMGRNHVFDDCKNPVSDIGQWYRR